MRGKIFRVLASIIGFGGTAAGVLFIILYFKKEPGIDLYFFIGAIVTMYMAVVFIRYGLTGHLPNFIKNSNK